MDNTLSSYCELIIDCEHKTAPTQNEGYPYIRTLNIGRGNLILDNVNRVSEEVYKIWSRRAEPKAGDIIFAREAPVGNVAMIPPNLKVCLGQRIVLIRADKTKIEPKYLMYLLLSDTMQEIFHNQTNGTIVAHLNLADIRKLIIPTLPNRNIQRRIVGILSAYDKLIENNSHRIKILEEIAQIIYQEWFVKFRFPGHKQSKFVESPLGMIPAGWKVKAVKDIIIFNPKISVKSGVENLYIAMEGLSTNSMTVTITENRKFISGSKFQNEDTLFARITPCLENGKTGYVQCLPSKESIGIGSTEFIVLRSKTLCSEYVYLLARSDNFRNLAIKSMSGASRRQRVNIDCFNDFLVAEPDKQTILNFQKIAKPIFQEINRLSKKNQLLKQTRDMLSPKLIAGEIDVLSC